MRSDKKSSFFLQLATIVMATLLIQSCGDGPSYFRQPELTPPEPFDTTQALSDSTTGDGLIIYIIEEGDGRSDKKVGVRDEVYVRFTGRTEDGKAFDSSYKDSTQGPSLFQNLTPVPKAGPNGRTISPLIDGFRIGLLGMIEGEKRTLIIPPELGYGDPDTSYSEGNLENNGGSLENETLRFDVELVGIR